MTEWKLNLVQQTLLWRLKLFKLPLSHTPFSRSPHPLFCCRHFLHVYIYTSIGYFSSFFQWPEPKIDYRLSIPAPALLWTAQYSWLQLSTASVPKYEAVNSLAEAKPACNLFWISIKANSANPRQEAGALNFILQALILDGGFPTCKNEVKFRGKFQPTPTPIKFVFINR